MNYRSDDRISGLLSDSSKERRYRKTSIGIKTSIMAWAVELFGTITIILIYYMANQIGFNAQWVVWVVISIYFVLIPGCYLLITDEVRGRIFDGGWYNLIRITCYKNKVSPSPAVVLEDSDKRKSPKVTASSRIPTVSRNIEEKISKPSYHSKCSSSGYSQGSVVNVY